MGKNFSLGSKLRKIFFFESFLRSTMKSSWITGPENKNKGRAFAGEKHTAAAGPERCGASAALAARSPPLCAELHAGTSASYRQPDPALNTHESPIARERLQRSNGGWEGDTGDPPRTARRLRLLTHPCPLPSPCLHPPRQCKGQSLDMRRWRFSEHWL